MNWKTRILKLKAQQLSIAEIAEHMGVTANAVRELVSGRTKHPRFDAATRLLELCAKHNVGEAPKREKARAA